MPAAALPQGRTAAPVYDAGRQVSQSVIGPIAK